MQAETLGQVVEPAAAERTERGLALAVTLPEQPGLYRAVTTLHGPDGVALDAATQARVPALVLRVSATTSAAYSFVNDIALSPRETLTFPVLVRNTGSAGWGHDRAAQQVAEPTLVHPRLTARWIALSPSGSPDGTGATARANVKPGKTKIFELALRAPSVPGSYALLLDVVTPDLGSLAARGVEPGFVRVTVVAEAAPAGGAPANVSGGASEP